MNINSKSTKAEIIAAYKELEKQNKSLETKIKQSVVDTSIINPVAKPTKTYQSDRTEPNITQTIHSLVKIKHNFGGAVSNLSEKLITEATKLATIRNAIAQETTQLKELHQLTQIEESTIDKLIIEYQSNAKKFVEQLSQARETSQQEIETLKQSWQKEQETNTRWIKTRNEEQYKAQQRAKEEYEYNLDLARDLDEEEYEQEQKLQQQELESNRKILEKQWQETETNIAKQEQEYAEAKEQVAALTAKLEAKVKQGKEEGKGIGTYQAKIKIDLRTKEIEGETENYQLRIESLEQTIKYQANRIDQLTLQLDTALKQVQDLAVKAIEGTSNRNSFEAMKAIAMEQAKTQPKGK